MAASTNALQITLHGSKAGLNADNDLVVNGRIVAPNSMKNPVRHQDDFLGDSVNAIWNSRVGSDGQCVAAAIAAAVGGHVALVAGDDVGATMALNGSQLEGALNFKASNGGLALEARVKLSAITSVSMFVGFTDQVAALEAPVISAGSGDTITTNATDAVGFMFDTAMSTDNLWAVGVANDVDATATNLTVAPVADTFITLRVEVTAAGVGKFYVDGVAYATVSGVVTPGTALAPVFTVFSRTTATRTLTVDYSDAQCFRV